MATGKCAQRGSVCFMKTKGWLPGQWPRAGGGPQARSPSTARLSKEPSSCRVSAGHRCSVALDPGAGCWGGDAQSTCLPLGFCFQRRKSTATELRAAQGLFGRLPLFASFPSRSREAKAFENF